MLNLFFCEDEIIMLIICQLGDPGALSMSSKRLHRITKDPYVRSSYFLTRHGPHQAFYWALARGKLVNERVLDVTLSPSPPVPSPDPAPYRSS